MKLQAFTTIPILLITLNTYALEYHRDTVLDFRIGQSQDFMQWSIASTLSGTVTPNILSELTWSNIDSIQTYVGVEHFLDSRRHFAFIGHISYGSIYSGDNQDSDYAGDNRTLEFSRSNNTSNEGSTTSFSLALGFDIFVNTDLILMPMFGYAEHKQNFKITDGYQTIPASGAFPGLNSSYDADWSGPWLGFKLGNRGDLRFYFDYRAHIVEYVGLANWNLRTDFQHPVSFRHDADGFGQTFQLGLAFDVNENFGLGLNYTYQDWQTDPGLDTVYFSNGNIGVTRLNEVVWTSDIYTFTVEVYF